MISPDVPISSAFEASGAIAGWSGADSELAVWGSPTPELARGLKARIAAEHAALHLSYESAPEWPLGKRETPGAAMDWRVKKMRLSADKTAVVYNDWLTLEGIPPDCFAYRLGNRSALEWVIDQYQVSTDSRSGIVSDPNRADDPQHIVRLVGQVVRVSVETVRLVGELAARVDVLAGVGVREEAEATAGVEA